MRNSADGFDPSRVDWREVPNVRKVGRYAFFAACAWGIALTAATVVAKGLGGNHDVVAMSGSLAGIIAFLTLRDMSKAWDFALRQQAKSLAKEEPDDASR